MNCSVPTYKEQFEGLTYIRPILQLYRNQAIYFACKLVDWFIYELKQSVAQSRHTALSNKKKTIWC